MIQIPPIITQKRWLMQCYNLFVSSMKKSRRTKTNGWVVSLRVPISGRQSWTSVIYNIDNKIYRINAHKNTDLSAHNKLYTQNYIQPNTSSFVYANTYVQLGPVVLLLVEFYSKFQLTCIFNPLHLRSYEMIKYFICWPFNLLIHIPR